MAKRANGQGAVYLRGDGRWEAQLRLAGGGRKSVYGRTRREVLGKLREARWAVGQRAASQFAKSDTCCFSGSLARGNQGSGPAQYLRELRAQRSPA